MYTYRIGLALLMAAIYALVFAGFYNSEFMMVVSIMALIVGTMLVVAGVRSAKTTKSRDTGSFWRHSARRKERTEWDTG